MALDGRQTTVWTALPGVIVSFDAVKQTCVVQPAIQGRNTTKDGVASFVDMPLCLDCPVVFPGGGGVTLTFPVTKGNECLLVFSSRCIDGWWQNGGVQPPLEIRMHDLSDGFALVGVRSQPRKLSGVSTSHAQLRSDDGEAFVDLDPTGHVVKIQATTATTATFSPSGIALHSPAGTLTHNGVNVGDTHVHGGVTTGGGNTLVPH